MLTPTHAVLSLGGHYTEGEYMSFGISHYRLFQSRLLQRTSFVFMVALASVPAWATVVRLQVQMDNGTSITVDNASGWSTADVTNLVIAADRSTQHDCVYTTAVKGLFKTGDRIFVNQNYLAWFDYTIGDGVQFPNPPYNNAWSRSGELVGFWSLDPVSHLFKYYRMGPSGCWNYPANEMIAGSASAGGGKYWWDHVTYGFEHALGVKYTGSDQNVHNLYMAFNYTQGNVTRTGFQQLLDGYESEPGVVHYKQKAKMMDAFGVTDISDGDNNNGVQAYLNAEVEYYCRPNDILSVFRFSPTATFTKNNTVVGFSSSYAQDMDGKTSPNGLINCDAGGAGEQWPSEDKITKRARYVQSSLTLINNLDDSQYPPNTFVQHVLGPTCPDVFANRDIYALGPQPGSWIRWGYSPTIDRSETRWQMINLGNPALGSGTNADPWNIQLGTILFGNETHDGTVGGVVMQQEEQVLQAGKWYQVYVAVSTNF